ncbi:MAG: tautomerase family protein [Propionibacteriales bacterium]|nr:tautomerase family protein [Propionibacteriales bacterium]
MPLVHLHLVEGRRTPDEVRRLADVVQQTLLDVFAAPERDRYQLISEHRPGHMIAEDTGLGIERTDDLVILQITQQGRDLDQKRALYATLAERLEAECRLAPSDLIVSLTENTTEDWSFGHGVAQFVEGLL